MKSEIARLTHEQLTMKERIKVSNPIVNVLAYHVCAPVCVKENTDKIKVFRVLPYLVSNVVEVSTNITLTGDV